MLIFFNFNKNHSRSKIDGKLTSVLRNHYGSKTAEIILNAYSPLRKNTVENDDYAKKQGMNHYVA